MLRILIVVAFAFFATSEACSCMRPKSLGDNLCSFPVSFRATIKDAHQTYVEGIQQMAYEVEIVEVFRNTTNNTLSHVIYTATNSAACGTEFEKSKEYLIFANEKMHTNLCSFNQQWDQIKPEDVKNLESGEYAKNCKT